MRKWGVVVSLFYAMILLGFIVPAFSLLLLTTTARFSSEFFDTLTNVFGSWMTEFVAAILIAGEAILLFLTVDTSQKRLKPRTHIAISYTVTAALFALLIFAGFSAFGVALSEKFLDYAWNSVAQVIAAWAGLWVLWGWFSTFTRATPPSLPRAFFPGYSKAAYLSCSLPFPAM